MTLLKKEKKKKSKFKKEKEAGQGIEHPCIPAAAVEALLCLLALEEPRCLGDYCSMPAVEEGGQEAAYAHTKAVAITDQGSTLIAPTNGTNPFLFTVNASSLRFQSACAQTGLRKS